MNEEQKKVLVFAPEKVIIDLLQQLNQSIYTTDLLSIDVDFPLEDIQALTFESNSFDWVVCNHVLEHVVDDQKAINECFRILKTGGVGIFTIPGNYFQPSTEYFPIPDGNGHHRFYGLDVCQNFERAGFRTTPYNMGSMFEKKFHIRSGDYAFVCQK